MNGWFIVIKERIHVLQKLKDLGEAAKGALLYIIAPIVFVCGYIYYLVSSKKTLEDKLAAQDSHKELDKEIEDANKAEKVSSDSIAKFYDAVELYESRRKRSLPGDNSDGGTGNKGPKDSN